MNNTKPGLVTCVSIVESAFMDFYYSYFGFQMLNADLYTIKDFLVRGEKLDCIKFIRSLINPTHQFNEMMADPYLSHLSPLVKEYLEAASKNALTSGCSLKTAKDWADSFYIAMRLDGWDMKK